MLEKLSITNYALIRHLDFSPGEGLSILTGDTGAGKSIMLKALALLSGDRADSRVMGDKNGKAVVEAVFSAIGGDLSEKISSIDPEWSGDEIIIRREISPSGRSRAFLNDSPISLSILSDIAKSLFDIHSQHGVAGLADPRVQLELVDAMSGVEDDMKSYRSLFDQYVSLRSRISDFHKNRRQAELQREIDESKLNKISALNPKRGELSQLEKKFEGLSNFESVRGRFDAALTALKGDEEGGAIENVKAAFSQLENIDMDLWDKLDSRISYRLSQCLIEIKDIAESLESQLSAMDFDPAELLAIEERINAYYRLIKELKVADDVELLDLRDRLNSDLLRFKEDSHDIEELEKKARSLALTLKEKSASISSERKKGAVVLESLVMDEARKLGLENIKFQINFIETKIGRQGLDAVEFLCAVNKNQEPVPIGKFASGGEMARLMLAIKKITAGKLQLPTVIFDEIDTGVSGGIADRMGDMMKEMGDKMQIIAITHLPQVASKGRRHFKVFKTDLADKTVSDIMLLDRKGREEELARMLSGKKINDVALQNARIMLDNN